MDEPGHNCGWCLAHSLEECYSFIKSLQHRGREAAGIAAVGDERIDVIKWRGPVNTFELKDLYKILKPENYHTFLGHVRYATRGRKEKILEDAHPHTIGGKIDERGSHIIITDCEVAGVHNGQVDEKYFRDLDKSLLRTECDTEAFLHLFRERGEYEILKEVPGAYTIAIADKRRKEIVVMRDRTGIKPGVLGFRDGKHAAASEDIVFKENKGEFIQDLEPGTVYYFAPNGSYRKEKVVDPNPRYCFFEWNYIAHQDSVLNGVSVRRIRELLGEKLAEEFSDLEADLVTYLPRCPEPAARSFARKLGLPFNYVFYKMRAERAFMGSTVSERQASIQQNLYLLPDNEKLKGKRVICIDDSLIRGNNSKRERELLYNAGVEKVYHLNYTPPIGIIGQDGKPRGCLFGVDMPPDDNFIARGRNLEEIEKEMGMPVRYISVEGMLEVFRKKGIPPENLCTYCIGGPHPFEDLE